MTTGQPGNGGDFSYGGTNEGEFFESIRRFADELAKSHPAVDRQALGELIVFYGKPDRTADPLLLLPPIEARSIQAAQREAGPSLADHPFFKRVAEIARERWSREMKELFDAGSYLIQLEIGVGITPELVPHPEVIQIILDARKTAFTYRALAADRLWKGNQSSGASRPEAPVSKKSPDLASIVADFVKKNW